MIKIVRLIFEEGKIVACTMTMEFMGLKKG